MTPEQLQDSPWDQIDAIPVINLDKRPERWEQIVETTKGIFPENKLIRFSAALGVAIPGYGESPWFNGKSTDSRWAARAGCTLSHQQIMTMAIEKGWQTFLILEDDADFSQTDGKELAAVVGKLLVDRSSWDICYLGFSKTRGPSRLVSDIGKRGTYEVSGCGTTHAYLVNVTARDWLARNLPAEDSIWPWIAKHRVIDRWYSWNLARHLKVLAVSPSIITQTTGYSDLVENNVDYNIEFPGKVTLVPDSSMGYHMARVSWRVKGMTTLLHDSIRYLLKCIKGF